MELNFITNDYLLTWNLLFGASISEEAHEFKMKLWATYKKQYNLMEQDKTELLSDMKNFIPDDDTLYNRIFETELFTRLKKETEKHRLELLKCYDDYKKELYKFIEEVLKVKIEKNYNIIALHPKMDTVLMLSKEHNMGWGRSKDLGNRIESLTEMVYMIVKNELGDYQNEYREIVQAILELAIKNELYTRLSGKSNYLEGEKTLKFLKRQIYPYWIMYLGAEKEEFTRYMMRDQMAFDIDQYPVETHLREVNFLGFIDFCVKNQRYILRINNLEII